MPVDTNSEEWQRADWIDYVRIEIGNFLSSNPNMAFRLEELVQYLVEEESQVFPAKILEDSQFAEWSRYALVSSELERMIWLEHVEVRDVDGDLYYTNGENARFPLPEIKHDVPEQIDEKIEKKSEELEERVQRLEYQFQQESDRF